MLGGSRRTRSPTEGRFRCKFQAGPPAGGPAAPQGPAVWRVLLYPGACGPRCCSRASSSTASSTCPSAAPPPSSACPRPRSLEAGRLPGAGSASRSTGGSTAGGQWPAATAKKSRTHSTARTGSRAVFAVWVRRLRLRELEEQQAAALQSSPPSLAGSELSEPSESLIVRPTPLGAPTAGPRLDGRATTEDSDSETEQALRSGDSHATPFPKTKSSKIAPNLKLIK